MSKLCARTSARPWNPRPTRRRCARSAKIFPSWGDAAGRLPAPLRQTFEKSSGFSSRLATRWSQGRRWKLRNYNFEALNIPEHHPAAGTIWIRFTWRTPAGGGGRPTAAARIPLPCKCARWKNAASCAHLSCRERSIAATIQTPTHGFMFHQIGGLAVDTDITFCDSRVRSNISCREFWAQSEDAFAAELFSVATSLQSKIDATCVFCGGPGGKVCKQSAGLGVVRRGDGRSGPSTVS